MVAEREAKTIGATLGYVEPEAPVDTLTLADLVAETVGETLKR